MAPRQRSPRFNFLVRYLVYWVVLSAIFSFLVPGLVLSHRLPRSTFAYEQVVLAALLVLLGLAIALVSLARARYWPLPTKWQSQPGYAGKEWRAIVFGTVVVVSGVALAYFNLRGLP